MSNAEMAKLAVQLDLQGNFTSALGSAEQKLGTFGTMAASKTTGALGTLERAAGRVGGALGHATGQIKSLITGPLGLLGLGGALLSLGGIIKSSVTKIEEFGTALEKVQLLTGETAKDSGTLILLFEKFGIGAEQVAKLAGFAEKTLGKLNSTMVATGKGAMSLTTAQDHLTKAHERLRLATLKLAADQAKKHVTVLTLTRDNYALRDAQRAVTKAQNDLTAAHQPAAAGMTKLQALDKLYGLQLVDSAGKVVSFSEELRQLAVFYDSSASASTKAYVASQVFGRQYATLLPVLAQGSQGLRDAAAAADQLGLGSSDTIAQITDFRTQMRDLGEAVNVTELSIGLALVPTLTKFARQVTAFVTDHRTDIAGFFRTAAHYADVAAAGIGDAVNTISGLWNQIPSGFRDAILATAAGEKVFKFLFGFSPIDSIFHVIEKAFAGSVEHALINQGIGKLFVQPVYVTNLGGLGGALGGAAGAAEGATGGLLSKTLKLLPWVAFGALIADGFIQGNKDHPETYGTGLPPGTPAPAPFTYGPRSALTDPRNSHYMGVIASQVSPGLSWGAQQDLERADQDIRSGNRDARASAAAIISALHLATGSLSDRLKHPVVNNYVTDWLKAALRIASSSETTAQKIKDLQAIKDKLDKGNHHQAYYLDRILAAEKAQKPPVVNLSVRGFTQVSLTRVTTTTMAGSGSYTVTARAGKNL